MSKLLHQGSPPEALFSYRDSRQTAAISLVGKWWSEAIVQNVANPEAWVAKQCAEEIKRAENVIKAGLEERGEP